ncbi:site-specific integrase [Rhizobium leguminosarum]|uniref:site-specific integrase n=1 Tax=Rhizobium leguminosarum TaxID=384 RepID=UPI00144213A9|nr:site-specific integrase [Rhizobium leguminosarum]MBY5869457.1 site-specific integrase [Rhizobium leguminosarum]NKM08794.1 tyrosine-type recombinase/integrase [Rhizobium leguminosarum bv. viciae]
MKAPVARRSTEVMDAVAAVARSLPPLPSVIRYHDDFADETRSIRWEDADTAILELDGHQQPLATRRFTIAETIMRHVITDWLSRLDPHTVGIYTESAAKAARHDCPDSFFDLFTCAPHEVRSIWTLQILPTISASSSQALRAMLHSLCRLNIGQWTQPDASVVRSLTSPKVDRYRVVRAGDCFMPLDQQTLIVSHIDDMCRLLAADPESLDNDTLLDVCILVLSFQYALRPGQLARVELADLRIYSVAVHFSFTIIKQKDKAKRTRETRKIKREWGPLFAELAERRRNGVLLPEEGISPRLLFGLTPAGVSKSIQELTEYLTGEPWTPTDIRHTAAQRMADAGVSREVLTQFLGQKSDRIADVYYDASPSQAEQINKALALSPIFSTVAKVGTTKTINMAILVGLPEEKQIGGVPHGVPIAGIGGCQLGQNLCMKNPVISCYTCPKFMALDEPEIHEEVLNGLRPVVTEFAAASRNNQMSPAYGQLKATLTAAQRLVDELRSEAES